MAFRLRSGLLSCCRHRDLYFLSTCCCFLPGNRPVQRLILSRLKPEKHQGWLILLLSHQSWCIILSAMKWHRINPFSSTLAAFLLLFSGAVCVGIWIWCLCSHFLFYFEGFLFLSLVKLYPLTLVYLGGFWPFLVSFCGFCLPQAFSELWVCFWCILWWGFIDFLLCYCAFILSWPQVWLFSIRSCVCFECLLPTTWCRYWVQMLRSGLRSDIRAVKTADTSDFSFQSVKTVGLRYFSALHSYLLIN